MIPYIITVSLFIIVIANLLHNFKKLKEDFLTLQGAYVLYVNRIDRYFTFDEDAYNDGRNRSVTINAQLNVNGQLTVRNSLTVVGDANISNSSFNSSILGNEDAVLGTGINGLTYRTLPSLERIFQLPDPPTAPPIELLKEYKEPKRPLMLEL